MNIYTIGHISPDLDTVAAAYAYADYLKKTNRYKGTKIIPLVSESPNKETVFIFEKFDASIPENVNNISLSGEDKVILVDHNEPSQRSPMLSDLEVVEIIDHHKVNINFAKLVRIDVKPYGSTSTIVYELYKNSDIKPSRDVLGVMLSAILSDTTGLKSSLTTGIDSEYAHEMAEELGEDIEKLTFELFRAKSDISGMSALDIAKKDFKVFEFGSKKVFINQVETVEQGTVLQMKDELINVMSDIKKAYAADFAVIIVSDILKMNSVALYSNEDEKHIIEKAFTAIAQEGTADIGPRMSRKKDIAPEIERVVLSL